MDFDKQRSIDLDEVVSTSKQQPLAHRTHRFRPIQVLRCVNVAIAVLLIIYALRGEFGRLFSSNEGNYIRTSLSKKEHEELFL